MLEVNNAKKVYGEGEAEVVALNNISLKVNTGDFMAIMGPSGSGKSTFLNVIGGLDRLSGGTVMLDGQRIDNLDENALVNIRRNRISYVFQQYHLLPSLTAVENVFLPLLFGGAGHGAIDQAFDLLKVVGLEKRVKHKPSQLSGGEQQRVAIARAIVHSPSLILADEPTGNMDQKTGNEILDIFDELNQKGLGIIMVTHSGDVAARAREVIYLEDGQIVDKVKQNVRNE